MNRFMILFSLFMLLTIGFSCQSPSLTLFNNTEEECVVWIFAHNLQFDGLGNIRKQEAFKTLGIKSYDQCDTIDIVSDIEISVYAEDKKQNTLCILKIFNFVKSFVENGILKLK